MVTDILTGSYAYGAIQSALLRRARTGNGECIDVTMMESMMMLISGQAFSRGRSAKRDSIKLVSLVVSTTG
ncbi:MAG: crotonobetainyl-CoA:carnitine CoA-transferase CaiB-like acyl-CoA transferase [Granulosicoccus sp.]|jgi:crotonobetainyl-CoA:carnitine CoA-transferase CaiB-like acyl-CoA transferase